jgi:uncharacterized protein YjbJ (UPF0337 family)
MWDPKQRSSVSVRQSRRLDWRLLHKGVTEVEGGCTMKDSTKDKVEGKTHEVKGSVKEKIGQMTNDRGTEGGGNAEKHAGKVQKKVGDVEKGAGR